ncbi:MAG: geranylgeranyl reductase family protein [Acidobacteria bacterium]|nr:geranylgeranyl reductase family protein [Acidobacteriota bacterium]
MSTTRDLPQVPVSTLGDRSCDVLVAGAGPAGSVAALHLARRGLRVVLADREAFPRDKVCGDGLIPDALRCLARAGLEQAVREHAHAAAGLTVSSPGRIEVDLAGEFLTLKRRDLDHLLAGAAVDAGARFVRGHVANIQSRGAEGLAVDFEGAADPVRARVAIVATGAGIELPRRLGMISSARPSAIALRCYVRSTHRIERLLVSFDRTILPGYAWIFPLGDGEYNVGCGIFERSKVHKVNLRELFRRFVEGFPAARALFERAGEPTPLKGAPLRCGLTGSSFLGPPGIVAAGEAVGATYAFTGEGIGKAMETAEAAAAAIAGALERGDPAELRQYPRAVDERLRVRYRSYDLAQQWLAHEWICDLVARKANQSTRVHDLLEGILSETNDPNEIFSMRGIVRALLRS